MPSDRTGGEISCETQHAKSTHDAQKWSKCRIRNYQISWKVQYTSQDGVVNTWTSNCPGLLARLRLLLALQVMCCLTVGQEQQLRLADTGLRPNAAAALRRSTTGINAKQAQFATEFEQIFVEQKISVSATARGRHRIPRTPNRKSSLLCEMARTWAIRCKTWDFSCTCQGLGMPTEWGLGSIESIGGKPVNIHIK